MQPRTIEILKSFSTINQGILIPAGNKLSTWSTAGNTFAFATVEDNFPRTFAIYNVPEFLSVLSLFDNPDIEYDEEFLTIKTEHQTVRYVYSHPNMVSHPPEGKSIVIRDPLLTFTLNKEQLNTFQKAAAALRSTNLIISKNKIQAVSERGNENSYTLKIADMQEESDIGDHSFNIRIESMKLIPNDYKVTVTEKFVAFEAINEELSYFIVMEAPKGE